jgi:hypothetical protein
MPQSLAQFSNAMKELYAPGLRNAKNERDLVGNEAVWSVASGRSSSTGARGELAALPTADRQRHIKPRRDLAYQYHTIKVSGPAKHLTRNDSSAFAKALDVEVKGAEKDLKNDLSRQVFGQALTVNGSLQTGVIATLSADPGASADFVVANEDESIMRHFFKGMKLDVINPADGAVRAGSPVEVLSINKSTRTITMTAAANAAVASGDFLVRQGNLNEEIDGLRFLINATQTYATINPATEPVWAALTAGSTTTGISEVVLDEALEVVETDGDGTDMSDALVVVEHVQRRKLASILQAQKRYDGKETTLKSGWKGLSLARGTLVADRYCPTTYFFGINRPELQKFVGLDFQWDEDDGDVFYKALDGSDAVEARFKGYIQLAATVRNCHVVGRLAVPSF